MEHNITILILPAAIALLIKLVVLFVSRNGIGRSAMFFTMVLVFACHNVAELLGFIEYFNGDRLTQVLRWYYLMSVFALAVMLLYAKEVSGIGENSKFLSVGIVGITAVLGTLVMLTDLVVAGSSSIGYIMTAEHGSYYWTFQAYTMLALTCISWLLVSGYRRAKDHLTQIQCSYTMFAMAPIVLAALLVVSLMAFGIKINAAGILPLMSTLFLLITLKSESQHGLTDIRRHVPFSLERRTSSDIMEIFSRYAKDEVNYRDSLAEIEKMLVLHKHAKNDHNVTITAATMNIPRSSLYSIFRRLKIEHSEGKETQRR